MAIHNTFPSFFSRIYEINTAFGKVAERIRISGTTNVTNNTPENKLVSECLDLLELIFLYGKSSHLRTILLNINEQDHNSDLGQLIINDWNADKHLKEFNIWMLFLWDNIVIGGVSPYTSVYTTPQIDFSQINLMGTNGNRLFGKNSTSLSKRGRIFQDYIISTCLQATEGSFSKEFMEYCLLHKTNLDNTDIKGTYTVQSNKWNKIEKLYPHNVNHNIYVAHDNNSSDYHIITQKKIEGQSTPLFLTSEGVIGATYWREMSWNASNIKLPACLESDIQQRTLPGTAIVYPYITSNDLFEEKITEIIGINYPNTGSFFFLHVNNRYFFIPVKRRYFNYFSHKELKKNIKISYHNENIIVSLSIPINYDKQPFCIISKNYSEDDITRCEDFFFVTTLAMQPENEHQYVSRSICSHKINLLDSEYYTTPLNFVDDTSTKAYTLIKTEERFNIIELNEPDKHGIIIAENFENRYDFEKSHFVINCSTSNISLNVIEREGYSRAITRAITNTDIIDSITGIDMNWRESSHTSLIKATEDEFLPLNNCRHQLFSFSIELYYQRLIWMMRIYSTHHNFDFSNITIIHDNELSITKRNRLRNSWLKALASHGYKHCNITMKSTAMAIADNLNNTVLHLNSRRVAVIELEENLSTVSILNQSSSTHYDEIATKRTLFTTTYFWGIHDEYSLTSDFIDSTLSGYKLYIEENGNFIKEKSLLLEYLNDISFLFLQWIDKQEPDKSLFWDYLHQNTHVRAKVLIFYTSILLYLESLTRETGNNLPNTILFSGEGTKIIKLLGEESILSKFASMFLTELTNERKDINVIMFQQDRAMRYHVDTPPITATAMDTVDLTSNDFYDILLSKEHFEKHTEMLQRLIGLLSGKNLSKAIYVLFDINISNYYKIKDSAYISTDYHLKKFIKSTPYNLYTITKEDLLFVQLMDYFSSAQGCDSILKIKRPLENMDIDSDIHEKKSDEKRIFISYKREEFSQVVKIKEYIEKETGYKCWMDLEGIESGSEFTEEIVKAINSANIFLFMLSNKSQQSKFALQELSFAKQKEDRRNKHFVVLVNIDGCKMNDMFSFNYQNLDTILYLDILQRNKLINSIRTWLKDV